MKKFLLITYKKVYIRGSDFYTKDYTVQEFDTYEAAKAVLNSVYSGNGTIVVNITD